MKTVEELDNEFWRAIGVTPQERKKLYLHTSTIGRYGDRDNVISYQIDSLWILDLCLIIRIVWYEEAKEYQILATTKLREFQELPPYISQVCGYQPALIYTIARIFERFKIENPKEFLMTKTQKKKS
jgi:hypothetical protein